MLSTRDEIRDHIRSITRETSDLNDLIEECINLTLAEINDFHSWSFLRRKYTLTSVDSQEDYQLPRDVDKIGLIRTTQRKMIHVPDELFYKWVPNPTAEATYPKYYRFWEEIGVATQISTDAEIDAVSDSASDDGATFTVTIAGLDDNGVFQTEVLTLDGTTKVEGSTTFSKILQVSKAVATTGTITVTEDDGDTPIVTLMPWERSPRFKTISFYPITSADGTSIYIEYFTRLKELVNGSDVPNLDTKWLWIVREGTLAKIYQYQNKEQSMIVTERRYRDGLFRMRKEDLLNIDYVPYLKDTQLARKVGIVELSDDTYVPWF